MSIAAAAWLAAASGLITGCISAFLRFKRPRRSYVIGYAIFGALLSVMSYGVFLSAGFLVSLLLFSGPPSPTPALLCAFIACLGFLLVSWLRSALGGPIHPRGPRDASGNPGLRDLLDSRPSGNHVKMWLAGVGIALIPVVYGVQCLWTGKGSLGTMIWSSPVEGIPAIALGLGWIGVGGFVHVHYCFGLHPWLAAHCRTGKLVALIAACAGFSIAGVWTIVARVPG